MKINHIGVAVKDMDETISAYEVLGYQFGERIEDSARNVVICFGENRGYRVELLQVLDKCRPSPIDGILKKTGGGGAAMYHTCYEAEDLEKEAARLRSKGFLAVLPPQEAIALQDRHVMFLMSVGAGLIELVETQV